MFILFISQLSLDVLICSFNNISQSAVFVQTIEKINQCCICELVNRQQVLYTFIQLRQTHTHTHTHIYMYIYIHVI